jgi:hypothetical protein
MLQESLYDHIKNCLRPQNSDSSNPPTVTARPMESLFFYYLCICYLIFYSCVSPFIHFFVLLHIFTYLSTDGGLCEYGNELSISTTAGNIFISWITVTLPRRTIHQTVNAGYLPDMTHLTVVRSLRWTKRSLLTEINEEAINSARR